MKRLNRILFLSSLEAASWGAAEELWYRTVVSARDFGVQPLVSVKAWPADPDAIRHLSSLEISLDRRQSLQDTSLLTTVDADLVLISLPDVFQGLPWMTACRKRGLPYATVTHYTAEFEWPDDSIRELLAEGYRHARRSFFVSRASRLLTERQIALRLENAETVRCPYKVPYLSDLPWPEERNGLSLACVARLDPEDKGQDLIFEVLSRPHWRRRPISVTLFGAGRFQRSLQAQLGYWGIENVRFGGYCTDVTSIWREHHGLILASRAEGLPAAIVEAMLCGRVCLVTDVGGNAELIRDGETGFVARFSRSDELDNALQHLWQRRADLQAMGRRAQDEVRLLVPENPAAVFCQRLVSLL